MNRIAAPFRGIQWLLLLFVIYLGAILCLEPPSDDSILLDDWDFARTVFHWQETGTLRLSDFPSMTLIGHLLWGRLFTEWFGATLTTLQISTMCMAWMGGCALYQTARRHQVPPSVATLLTATYVSNPIIFYESYTFMTDVAGCSWMLVTIYVGDLWISSEMQAADRSKSASAISILLGLVIACGYLTRQTTLVPAIALGCLAIPAVLSRHVRLGQYLLVSLTATIPAMAFWYWLQQIHGLPIGFDKAMLDLNQIAAPKIIIVKCARIAITLGLFLLPWLFAAILVPFRKRASDSHASERLTGFWRAARGLAICTILTGLAMLLPNTLLPILSPYWGVSPFDFHVGNLPPIEGLRAATTPTYVPLPAEWSSYGLVILRLVIGFGLTGVFLGALSGLSTLRNTNIRVPIWETMAKRFHSTQLVVLLAAFGHLILLLLLWDLYDRYLAPLFTLLLSSLIWSPVWQFAENGIEHSPRRARQLAILGIGIGLIAAASLAMVHHSRNQFESVWREADRLVASGVTADQIDAGLPYYGFRVYRPKFEQAIETGEFADWTRERRSSAFLPSESARYRFVLRENWREDDPTELDTIGRFRIPGWFRDLDIAIIDQTGAEQNLNE